MAARNLERGKGSEIFVDADACPVKEIILRLAKRRNIPVTMVIDTSKGPKKRTREDDERFEAAFDRMLDY